MPHAGLSDITILLDRSGSMESIRNDTIGGFNVFIDGQKSGPGEAVVSLVQFNTGGHDVVYAGKKLAEVPKLSRETFVPSGGTPLLDSLGRLINDTGKRFADTPEHDRPERVFFVIVTDGQENSSHEFTRAKIKEMIQHQTEVYKWDFVYLGANQDSFTEAGGIGIQADGVMNYTPTSGSAGMVYANASAGVLRARSTSSPMCFSPKEREAQEAVAGK